MSSIVTVPHPVLRQVAKPVTVIDRRVLDTIQNMTRALLSAKDPEGIGLAAPQIGIPLKIFLIRPDLNKPPVLFINPEITDYSQRQQTPETKKGVYEGCLSVPHHYSPIKRSMSVTVKYQVLKKVNDKWEMIDKSDVFTGFTAHIIQHEMDHLNGILFIDHVLAQNSKLYLIKGDVCEEISL
jgi:peptide deformylase